MTNEIDLKLMGLLVKSDMSVRKNNPYRVDIVSDVQIITDLKLPVVNDDQFFKKSLAYRMLHNREERPTHKTWRIFKKTAEDFSLTKENAAELYFHLLDMQSVQPVKEVAIIEEKKYPMRDDTIPAEEAPPNVVGMAMGGLGLMGDGKKDECD